MDGRVVILVLISLFIFSGCSEESYEKSNKVMFIAEEVNWSTENSSEDYWINNTWEVSYDGTVKYSETYNLTGVKNKKNWKLKKDQLHLLQDILENDFQKLEDEYDSAADGIGWNMVYYNKNSEEISEFDDFEKKSQVLNPST
ncbi:hypothetical protein [Novisyntrophococcus fermenticellae]|uniref:hypothetical protein n=1 Tax=Novisyntrophococcus fermenticellae TaxID=2068655 RepID=UPI001E386632|nr:hypothetical protein [Novisyntrophococcus fermenticellae]